MKVGDLVRWESNTETGVIIEYESFNLYMTTGAGITKMDIDLKQQRHKARGDLWRVLWADGIMESCWGSDLEVING